VRTAAWIVAAILLIGGCRERSPTHGAALEAQPPPAAEESFVDPTLTHEQRLALGPVSALPRALERALSGRGFLPLPPPGPRDWLSAHPEPGQTFAQFVASKPNVPDARRRALAILPLGELPPEMAKAEGLLRDYLAAFYSLPARLLPAASITDARVRTRIHKDTGRRQLFTPDILDFLRGRLPGDAFSLSGVTAEDLYPLESWNFVFGQASLRDRVGVFSFARYDPAFYGDTPREDDGRLRLRRMLKVLSHEVGHMFGLKHCVYFSCVMNGSNHLEEADGRPFHPCPVCLRKLEHAIGFDVVARYEALERFYRAAGFSQDASWVAARLQEIRE
jgi:archaemetzincin